MVKKGKNDEEVKGDTKLKSKQSASKQMDEEMMKNPVEFKKKLN